MFEGFLKFFIVVALILLITFLSLVIISSTVESFDNSVKTEAVFENKLPSDVCFIDNKPQIFDASYAYGGIVILPYINTSGDYVVLKYKFKTMELQSKNILENGELCK